MSINTTELLNRLKQSSDIALFLEEYEQEFLNWKAKDYLTEMATAKGLSLSQIASRSGQGEYVYKVFKGERKPSRDVILAICIGTQLNVEEAQLLLRISKLAALDPRDKRDSIILYAIKECFDIHKANDLLYEMREQTL